MATEYFRFNTWTFINKKFVALNKKIYKMDEKNFYFYHENVDTAEFYKMAMTGGLKYLVKVNVDDDNQRRNQRR